MRLSLGLSMGGGASRTLRSFVAQASPSTGLLTLPSWLTIACATASRTTQTSASTLVTGIGANAARARNVGNGWGLSVECARTNAVPNSDSWSGGGWTVGAMAVTASQADPAGGTAATLFTSAGNDYSNYVITSEQTYTTWAKGVTGSSPYAHLVENGPQFVDITSSAWARIGYTRAANSAGGALQLSTRNNPAGIGVLPASSFVAFGAQSEASVLYPSSYLPTPGGSRARAADVLTCPTPTSMAPGGFFNLDMTVAPNYAQAEFAADHNLVYFDASNRLFIQRSTQKVVLRIGGADVLSSALTWSRDQGLRIQAQHRASGRRLIVTGATTGNGDSGIQSAASAISLPGTLGILGDGTTTVECADLRSLTVRRP